MPFIYPAKFSDKEFTANDIAVSTLEGLNINLDASISTSIRSGASVAVDGDPVTSFNDQSGNNYHATQATSANMPEYQATGWSGLPCVAFDPLDDYLSFLDAGALALANAADGLTIIHVADLTLDGAYRQVFGIQAPNPYHERFSYFLNSYGMQQRLFMAGRLDADTQATLTSTGAVCAGGKTVESISIDYCSGAAHICRNGVVLAENSTMGTMNGKTSATAPNYWRIGNDSGGANQKVAQHIVVTRYMSKLEIELYHKHLMTKWGIDW